MISTSLDTIEQHRAPSALSICGGPRTSVRQQSDEAIERCLPTDVLDLSRFHEVEARPRNEPSTFGEFMGGAVPALSGIDEAYEVTMEICVNPPGNMGYLIRLCSEITIKKVSG
jgi:hypothetical protein